MLDPSDRQKYQAKEAEAATPSTNCTVVEETKIKDDEILDMYTRAGEVYQNVIKTPKQVGYYRIGKSFNIFFEKKPCGPHRFFTKVLLGWNWFDQK